MSINLIIFSFYVIFINCFTKTVHYCIDNNNGKICQGHSSLISNYISKSELTDHFFSQQNNIFIYIYTDITLEDTILKNYKSKLTISSNGKNKVFLNVNDFDKYSISFNNVQISSSINKFKINSIELTHSEFINSDSISIISNIFISDSFSLRSFSSIQTQKIELTQDEANHKKVDIFIMKGSNYHYFSQDNPQILIFNQINSEIIFGLNYIDFMNFKIISQIYPFIEIENIAGQFDVKCHSGLVQSVLLTPIIHMVSGKCIFYGSKWPQLPKKINPYWEFDKFYDAKEREIRVILESDSSIGIHGNKIPISIKSNGRLTIYCEFKECGITGNIYISTLEDRLISNIKEKVKFYVSDIINLTYSSVLHSTNSKVNVIVETCRNSFVLSGLSNHICNSIDNDLGMLKSKVNLVENGNFTYHMKLNVDSVVARLKKILQFKPLGYIYDQDGLLNISAILDYAADTLDITASTALSVISALKSLGNNIIGVDFINTKGKHQVTIKRKDIMYSLFYYNLFKYNKYLVYTQSEFDLNDWNIVFDDYKPNQVNIPFLDFTETNINYTARNYMNNETTYGLQMKVDEYPNSAIEVLFHSTDSKLEGKFKWISGILINFVPQKRLNSIRSVMSNPQSKNIIFLTLNDLKSPLNLKPIRNDSNVIIFGVTMSIFDEVKKGIENINFDIVRPNITFYHNSLNSLGFLLCKINETRINASNFVAVASDILYKDKFVINSNDVVFDISTWKQIENNGINYQFKNFVLLPFELKPTLKYDTIQKVEFLNDRWKIHFSNSECEVMYSTVSERLLIMTGINESLELKIDDSFNEKTVLKPLEIGYNVGLQKKLSNFPGVPLLSEDGTKNMETHSKSEFHFDFFKMFRSVLSKYLKIDLDENTDDEQVENIIFQGDWNSIKDLSGKLVYNSDKRNLKITNFPLNHFEKIEFTSKKSVTLGNFIKDGSTAKTKISCSRPLIINGQQELLIPSDSEIEFDNITVTGKGSSLNLIRNDNLVKTRHFKAEDGSSSQFKNISISGSIELRPNTLTIFESTTFSKDIKIDYFYSLEKRFPLLVIENKDASLSSVTVHYNSNRPQSNNEIINNYNILPQIILKKSTTENECSKLSKIFTFQNPNKAVSLFCEFSQNENDSYTNIGLNLTVDIVEGSIEIDKKKSDSKLIIILASTIGGVVVVAAVLVIYILIIKKKRVKKDESATPLTSDNSQLMNNNDNILESED